MSLVQSLLDSAQLAMRRARLSNSPARSPAAAFGKHLALLAWALPPNTNAGVHRPLSLLRYAADAGWRVSAFHGKAPANQRQHGDELVRALPPQVKLHELADSELQPVWRWTPQIDGGFTHALAFAEQALEQLRADPPSLILASGPPFMVFVAARWLARQLGVPYVLDYRDEWSECPFDFVSHGRDDKTWERRCIADAQAVIFTTESHRLHQLRQFPELQAERTHLIPNGWEAGDFDATAQAATHVAQPERFTLAHVGNLAGHTSPRSFLASVERLIDQAPHWRQGLRLQFIGRRSPEAERALSEFRYADMLDLVDHVSKREAAQRMQSSDALLLLANEDLARYLPSKLFDYVASRRPVLVYGHAGEASELAGKLNAGLLCDESADLGKALAALQALRPDPHQISAWLDAHRRDVLSKRFFALFDTPAEPAMKVSVVIPTYNRRHVLAAAVDSALGQLADAELEVIVVDDGSTDGSAAWLLERYAGRPVRVLKNQGLKGPAGGRNTGMRAAQGEFIALLDSDDAFLPGHLEQALQAFEQHPELGLVFGRARYERNGQVEDYMGPNFRRKLGLAPRQHEDSRLVVFGDGFFDHLLEQGCWFNLSSVVLRRAAVGAGMNEALRISEDYEFWVRLSRSQRFGCLLDEQIRYTLHDENISFEATQTTADHAPRLLQALNVMRAYDGLTAGQMRRIDAQAAQILYDWAYRCTQARQWREAAGLHMRSLQRGLWRPNLVALAKLPLKPWVSRS